MRGVQFQVWLIHLCASGPQINQKNVDRKKERKMERKTGHQTEERKRRKTFRKNTYFPLPRRAMHEEEGGKFPGAVRRREQSIQWFLVESSIEKGRLGKRTN